MLTVGVPMETAELVEEFELLPFPFPANARPAPAPAAMAAMTNHFVLPLWVEGAVEGVLTETLGSAEVVD